MDPVIQKLDQYGYFFSPTALVVDADAHKHVNKLTRNDPVVIAAVGEYQKYFKGHLDELTVIYHGRSAIVDGDIGPATHDLVHAKRCGMPDFMPAGFEEARFPDSCRETISTSYRMSLNGLSDTELQELWIRADKNWSDVLNVNFVLDLGSYPQTNIHASEANLSESVLADQFLSTGRCGDRLRGRFDSRTWNRALFLATCCHEHGHALGLGHLNDRNAIMYPSIHSAGMARGGTPNESDIRAMVGLGYKRRTNPIPDPPKPPTKPRVLATVDVSGIDTIQVVGGTVEDNGGWKI